MSDEIEIRSIEIRLTDLTTITLFAKQQRVEVRAHFPSGEQRGETEKMTIAQMLEVCQELRNRARPHE